MDAEKVIEPTTPTSTPGAHIARAASALPEVRMVAETVDRGVYFVIVLLDTDPNAIPDPILDAEQELYTLLPDLRFDVRVRRTRGRREERLLHGAVVHYRRR